MAPKSKVASPVLGATMAAIGHAGELLVTRDSRFRHTFEVPLDRISPDPDQPRKVFSEAEVTALAATMAEQGQLQPVLLRRAPGQRGNFILVAGERRWRAARLNGWGEILAIEHDGDPEVASLVENLQRVDLTPVEEARGLQHLIEGKGWTQTQAAEALGKTKGEVSATLRILTLPGAVLEGVLTSELDIPRNVLVELARIEESSLREELLELARAGALTVRAIRNARLAQGERASKVRPASDKPTSLLTQPESGGTLLNRFSLRSLDRVTGGLRMLRIAGQFVHPIDRERLLALRQEIDALLGSAKEESEM